MDSFNQHNSVNSNANYWNSVGLSGVIFGVLYFLIPLFLGYVVMGSGGGLGSLAIFFLSMCLACLIGAFGGFAAVWHHLNIGVQYIDLSRGALIGFLTGVIIALLNTVFTQIWTFVDPNYMENLTEGLIAVIENTNLPEAQKQTQIDSIAGMFQESTSFSGAFFSFLMNGIMYGILNLITGMIGAKVFGKEEDELA